MVDLKNLSDQLSNLTILEAAELVQSLEKKWNISSQNITAPNQNQEEKKVEKTSFDISLIDVGAKKIQVIKAIREITSLNLKEAKALVDNIPKVIKSNIPKDEAKVIQDKLEKSGAKVSIN